MAKSKNTTKTDDVAGDLLQIVNDSRVVEKSWESNTPQVNKDLLMQKLCSYIVRRDAKVFDHAFKLGQSELKKQIRTRIYKGQKRQFKQEYPNGKTQS